MNRDGHCCRQGHRLRGDRPCGVCRREQTLAAVVAAEPSLTARQVTGAFDAAVTSGAALRHLAVALADGPEVLHVGAPPVVGRLVAELIASGSTTFTVPCVWSVDVRAGR